MQQDAGKGLTTRAALPLTPSADLNPSENWLATAMVDTEHSAAQPAAFAPLRVASQTQSFCTFCLSSSCFCAAIVDISRVHEAKQSLLSGLAQAAWNLGTLLDDLEAVPVEFRNPAATAAILHFDGVTCVCMLPTLISSIETSCLGLPVTARTYSAGRARNLAVYCDQSQALRP